MFDDVEGRNDELTLGRQCREVCQRIAVMGRQASRSAVQQHPVVDIDANNVDIPILKKLQPFSPSAPQIDGRDIRISLMERQNEGQIYFKPLLYDVTRTPEVVLEVTIERIGRFARQKGSRIRGRE
jgi:hypothetical protein